MSKEKKKKLETLIKRANKGALYFIAGKKPKKKTIYKMTLTHWKAYVTELILMINQLDVGDYIYETDRGRYYKDLKFDKAFKNASVFTWDAASIEEDGTMFRGKMCTLILFWLLRNSKKICNVISEQVEGKPIETKRRILRSIIVRVGVFVSNFLAGDTYYGESLIEIMELMLACTNMKKANKFLKMLMNQKTGIIDTLKNGDIEDEKIVWDSIIKLSYMFATGSMNFKNIQFIKKLDVRNKDMVKESVGRLGIAIMIQRCGTKRIPPLYRMYQLCHPVYFTSFQEVNEANELNYGVAAINFLRFVLDDDIVTKFIEEVM